mmetsp:Transcript_11683/g.32823  ORF Transcript_11683/g.32823 Transcript_11683/m.32823 type:complete len:230 (-) Transcript_11683:368-1057(-)
MRFPSSACRAAFPGPSPIRCGCGPTLLRPERRTSRPSPFPHSRTIGGICVGRTCFSSAPSTETDQAPSTSPSSPSCTRTCGSCSTRTSFTSPRRSADSSPRSSGFLFSWSGRRSTWPASYRPATRQKNSTALGPRASLPVASRSPPSWMIRTSTFLRIFRRSWCPSKDGRRARRRSFPTYSVSAAPLTRWTRDACRRCRPLIWPATASSVATRSSPWWSRRNPCSSRST